MKAAWVIDQTDYKKKPSKKKFKLFKKKSVSKKKQIVTDSTDLNVRPTGDNNSSMAAAASAVTTAATSAAAASIVVVIDSDDEDSDDEDAAPPSVDTADADAGNTIVRQSIQIGSFDDIYSTNDSV